MKYDILMSREIGIKMRVEANNATDAVRLANEDLNEDIKQFVIEETVDRQELLEIKRISRKPVIIESPYAGDIENNKAYLKLCILDSLERGEAPFASHGFYTQEDLLNDNNIDEREMGIEAGYAFGELVDTIAVYDNLGISIGMTEAIDHYKQHGKVIEYRTLGDK